MSRRALNGTGRLIEQQLDEWSDLEDPLREAGFWTAEVDELVDEGSTLSIELGMVVHGSSVQLMPSQWAMTKWLQQSRGLVLEANGALRAITAVDTDPATAGLSQKSPKKPSVDPDARANRQAEIAAIRASYEQPPDDEDPLQCPQCGVRFSDEPTCVNHILSEHGNDARP